MRVRPIISRISLLAVVVLTTFTFGSCYYDKYEQLHPVTKCDSIPSVSYALHVKEIVDRNCISCHAAPASSGGGIVLDSYQALKQEAMTGKLYSAITWDGNAVFMPKDATQKLDECSIRIIKRWINEGYAQ